MTNLVIQHGDRAGKRAFISHCECGTYFGITTTLDELIPEWEEHLLTDCPSFP